MQALDVDSAQHKSAAQDAFAKLKPTCVALLGKSALSPATASSVLALLTNLLDTLRSLKSISIVLTSSLIDYVFFPLSTILRRNPGSAVPDQVLEQILRILALLCEEWWWTFEPDVWEQIWMLAGSVLVDGLAMGDGKGKSKARDDETKEAAVCCLIALLHERTVEAGEHRFIDSEERFHMFRRRALERKTLPILGQTLSSVLDTALSSHTPLQQHSLDLLRILLTSYFDTGHVPSFLPGVVSVMCKVALGEGRSSYQRGEIVRLTLDILRMGIEKGIGNDVCRQAGLIHKISGLDDLRDIGRTPSPMSSSEEAKPALFRTPRTDSWYRATSSQLLLALNSLVPLLKHPNSLALQGLGELYGGLLISCSDSLPDTLQLLLSALLSLSLSGYPNVSEPARQALATSLSTSPTALSTLVQVAYSNLAVLPTFIPSGLDEKIQFAAAQVEATCRLASEKSLDTLASGVGQLLGPNGGIEKWGVSLLYSLRFEVPSVVPLVGADHLLTSSEQAVFPSFLLRNISSSQTMGALERMLRSLGSAGGEEALFAVEWFVGVAKAGRTSQEVAALWCAGRLLEGVAEVVLGSESSPQIARSQRLLKFCKRLAKDLAELWDIDDEEAPLQTPSEPEDPLLPVERHIGISQIQKLLDLRTDSESDSAAPDRSPVLHVALSLQLLALTSQIIATSFSTLFLQVLYPVLHSVVSTVPAISKTGMCCLQVITQSTGYASPANLLLSNFDYALDAASHRLTRARLDLQATAVLITLIRIVGKDVVERAGDVIEECFDRLDEFHGYSVLVEGLMQVLTEVISALEPEESLSPASDSIASSEDDELMRNGFDVFLEWHLRRDIPEPAVETEDIGPTPQVPWSKTRSEQPEEGEPQEDEKPPPTPSQLLAKQIVAKSMYFLTHGSPLIRAQVLTLLATATPLLSQSDLLPYVHSAWPFMLNRLDDPEVFVTCEAATFIRRLVEHVGGFMTGRIWDDVWPRFRKILQKLAAADTSNALTQRSSSLGPASAYTSSHRLYTAILGTMTAAVINIQIRDHLAWEVALLLRRFLQKEAAEDLQSMGRQFYISLGRSNADAVWLILMGTGGEVGSISLPQFLRDQRWDIIENTRIILDSLV